jgi:hypothetical protein
MNRLNTPATPRWTAKRDELKRLWFDCYIRGALNSTGNFERLPSNPATELRRTREVWDRRRAKFQVRTPEKHVNALRNWARAFSEYHRRSAGTAGVGWITRL